MLIAVDVILWCILISDAFEFTTSKYKTLGNHLSFPLWVKTKIMMSMAAKYILLLHVYVVFASFFTLSDARPEGAPSAACVVAQPIHMNAGTPVLPLSSNNPYIFNVTVSEYVPGENLQVTIEEASGGMVNGFFLQARRIDTNAAVGTFMGTLPTGAKLLQCTTAADTVTHTNANDKTGLTFTWRAPDAGMGQIQFVGAVAEDHDNFYGGMMSALLEEGNPVTMEPTNTTGSAVTMEPTNTTDTMTDAAGQTTAMESITANAVVLSSGFGVLLVALVASILQLFA